MKPETSPYNECLDGVYCTMPDGYTVAADNHLSLRVLALQRAKDNRVPYRDAGNEIYPANVGHMLSHGPVAKMALWQNIGQSGRRSFALPGAVVADAIASEIAIKNDPNDPRRPQFIGWPNGEAQWVALADAVRGEILTVTISLTDTGSYVMVQLDATHAAAFPWLWDGRLPVETCMGWVDGLITEWLESQAGHTESEAAKESLQAAVDRIAAATQAAADYQARAKALRDAGALSPDIGLVKHGFGLGDPQCEYEVITPIPGDCVMQVDYAAVEWDEMRTRQGALALGRRLGADLSRNVVIVVRAAQGNGCKYDAVIYLAASKDAYWHTPGITSGCTRFGIKADYGK